MNAFQYATAHSPESARELVADNGAYLAGGNDLLGLLKDYLGQRHHPGEHQVAAWLEQNRARGEGLDHRRPRHGRGNRARRRDQAAFPGLHEAAAEIGSQQIRNVATVGGNLAQHSRCWYFRHRDTVCLKKHGDLCYARHGENRYHSLFTGNDCISPVVSSLATVLAALDATAIVPSDEPKRSD